MNIHPYADQRLDADDSASILIVEDERASRRALSMLLNASGYRTRTATNAEEVLAMLEAGSAAFLPRCALIDLDLPGMNGIELIRHLRRVAPWIRTILVTAAGEERVRRLLTTDRVPYFSKPLDFDRLLAALNGSSHN